MDTDEILQQIDPNSFLRNFEDLPDPRLDRGKHHSLHNILSIALTASICGVNDWVGMEWFAQAQRPWLETFLEMPNGIPSHDTLSRVFSLLNPVQFNDCFHRWMSSFQPLEEGDVIALDGKSLRGSRDTNSSTLATHTVNAFSTKTGLCFGQLAVDRKSNEIAAIPALLKRLSLKGCVVTTDAMGCQKEIASTIVDNEADYLFSLKGNQGNLHKEVAEYFKTHCSEKRSDKSNSIAFHETVDGEHGRIETRRCWSTEDLSSISEAAKWINLRSIILVESERWLGDKISVEARFFVSSLPGTDAANTARVVRQHWAIENSLHRVLDVAFREDHCRTRTGYAAENLGLLRKITLNLLKKETTVKCGIANKRLIAASSRDYLTKVLKGI